MDSNKPINYEVDPVLYGKNDAFDDKFNRLSQAYPTRLPQGFPIYLKNFPSRTQYMHHVTDDRAGAVRDGPAAALRDDRGRAAEELLLPAARVPAV